MSTADVVDEEYTSIEMDEIAKTIKEKFRDTAPSRTSGCCFIHRVPAKLHNRTQPSAYRPETFSFGPFHCGIQSLKVTQDLKLLYAHTLLTRKIKQNPGEEESAATAATQTVKLASSTLVVEGRWLTLFEECVSSIKKIETKIRHCYSEPLDLDSREFVTMMVIDGLFIIELFLSYYLRKFFRVDEDLVDADPLRCNNWLWIGVKRDLLLLENQLPLFVLEHLFDILVFKEKFEGVPLMKIILYFFKNESGLLPAKLPLDANLEHCIEEAKHLLDLLAMLLKPSPKTTSHSPSSPWNIKNIMMKCTSRVDDSTGENKRAQKRTLWMPPDFIPSAAELSRAGVKFKKGSDELTFMDIKFVDGTFEMPQIVIHNETALMLRNLIALEQSHDKSIDMICYATLMDSLINSAEDVEVLRNQGIIVNYFGCHEDVSNIFNNLCFEETSNNHDYYHNLSEEVGVYYKKSWHTWKATLKREYFNSPWTIISVFAATLLILLTITSTVFTILSVMIKS
ncbi:hypothetical protein MKW94_006451 [Papaver nudicaule]|uniref:Uncharacterized protein n=1 Tax=Papaver nudicaule TaxID=74823 RepID=A0AA41SCI3_PAPNU|nr:hypothetical protein [Papaver nudicaule]